MWHFVYIREAVKIVALIALAVCVGALGGITAPYRAQAADVIPALQVASDEANTLRLEAAVNTTRQSYGQPPRTPSNKLRNVARHWKIIYTPFATNYESTLLYGIILDDVRDATFATSEIYYSAFDMENGADPWTPEQIAAYWRVTEVGPFVYGDPRYLQMGCGYRVKAGRTQAFCVYGTEWGTEATATPTPGPLRLPSTPSNRPLVTATPRYGR